MHFLIESYASRKNHARSVKQCYARVIHIELKTTTSQDDIALSHGLSLASNSLSAFLRLSFSPSLSCPQSAACKERGMRVAAFIGNTNFLLAVYLTADLFVARASPAAGNGEEDRVNDVKHKTLRGPGQST